MKFTVSSTALLKHLHALKGVIHGRSIMPILDYFLFVLEGTQLTVTASDLETTLSATIPVEAKSDGMVAIPARRLVRVLKVLPPQHLTITVDKGFRARISCDQGTYEIPGYTAGEYPQTPVIEGASTFSIPASSLNKGIAKTLWAAGSDDLRPVMAGVFVKLAEDATRFVATDAHILVVHSCTALKHSKAASFILPKKTCKSLLKYMAETSGDVSVAFNEHQAQFTFDNVVAICRLINGSYPKYDAVIPKEAPNRITVDRLLFLGAVRRMEVFANMTTHLVRFRLDAGAVAMSAEDLDDNSTATERLTCVYEGEALSIGFNAHFLLDVLKNINCEQVVVRMQAPNKAATIVDAASPCEESTLSLLMSVMLND